MTLKLRRPTLICQIENLFNEFNEVFLNVTTLMLQNINDADKII